MDYVLGKDLVLIFIEKYMNEMTEEGLAGNPWKTEYVIPICKWIKMTSNKEE